MKNSSSHPSINPKASSSITRQDLIKSIQNLLTSDVEEELRKIAKTTKRAILTPFIMVASSLQLVASEDDSYLKVFESMKIGTWFTKEKPIGVKHQSFYQRFRQISPDCMDFLVKEVSETPTSLGVRNIPHLPSYISEVYALDQTTLEQISRKVFLRDRGRKKLEESGIPGKISALMNLKTNLYENIIFHDDYRENEKVSARKMLEGILKKSLLLADTGFFSFRWFDDLHEMGHYFISRVRNNTSFTVNDVVISIPCYREKRVYLGKHRSAMGAHSFRLIEIKVGKKWWRYITNMNIPSKLLPKSIVSLYSLRWNIESSFQQLKETLKLNNLRLCDQVGVKWQLWSTLIVYQLVQRMVLELSECINVDCTAISLYNVLKAIEKYIRRQVEQKEGLSCFDWMVKHAKSLNLVKKSRKKDRKSDKALEEIEKLDLPCLEAKESLESREPRYDSKNRKKSHSGAIVSMKRKKAKKKK